MQTVVEPTETSNAVAVLTVSPSKPKRARKPKTFTIGEYVEAEGPTLAEARKNAIAEASRMLDGSYGPRLYEYTRNGQTLQAIVSRAPSGYGYSIIWGDTWKRANAGGINLGGYGCDTFAEAVRRMQSHLAQALFTLDGDDCLDVIHNQEDRNNHASWVRWQHAYAECQSAGFSDNDAWSYVNHDPIMAIERRNALARILDAHRKASAA